MAAATKATIGRIEISDTPYATLARPTTAATPRMISHSCLVCLPAAGKDPAGRRTASTKAHTSTTTAASMSASKNQKSGVKAPEENTVSGYRVRPVRGHRSGCPAHGQGRGRAQPLGRHGSGGISLADPPRRPGRQALVERGWLRWLCLPLSAPLAWPLVRPLSAFSPRLASLSYSVAARVRAVVT